MRYISTALTEFKRSDELSRLATTSQHRHLYVLNLLVEECGPTMPVNKLTRSHVDHVLADRRSNGCGDATINSYKCSLRLFGRWLLSVGYTRTEVTSHLRGVKAPIDRSKRKPLTSARLREMLALAGARHPRDRVTLALLIFTAVRGSEVCGLRWRDIDFAMNRIVLYRPKMRDLHQVAMNLELVTELEAWRAWVVAHHGEPKSSDHVVPALERRGAPGFVPIAMNPEWPLSQPTRPQSSLGTRVKNLMRQAGEQDLHGRATHTIRRSSANLVYTATGDIRAAQVLLGHTSVTMTEVYLDVDEAAIRYGQAIREWTL